MALGLNQSQWKNTEDARIEEEIFRLFATVVAVKGVGTITPGRSLPEQALLSRVMASSES